ncbi:MAG: hypothetical protein H7122_01220 [Chitinophagaceae bacterium]|nr:hypothetical protein [Chitinophagaceae bacterium]
MRVLLFIPVLVLFLSNVPFVQRIPLERMIAMMQNNENCGDSKDCVRNNENFQASCSREELARDQTCIEETTIQDPASDDCCQKTETTCVCICCFQFAAPLQAITDFQFDCTVSSNISSRFIVGHVKDPHIGAPWQPPDLV